MRRALLGTALLLMLALAGGPAQAAITLDVVATAASATSAGTTLSWSHTAGAGSSVFLIVGVAFRVDNSGSGPPGQGTYIATGGITANSLALTCVVAITDNNTGSCGTAGGAGSQAPFTRSEIWYRNLGTLGSSTAESISVTITPGNSGANTAIAATSITYFSTASEASGGDAYSNNGVTGKTSISPSLTVTATSSQVVVSNLAIARSSTSVASTPNTRLSDVLDTITGSVVGHIQDATSSASATNPTMGWTWTTASPYALTAVVLTATATAAKRKGQTVIGALQPPGGVGSSE